jgi:hypothetical protein
VIYPDPLSPVASASSAMKTPENTEEDPDDCEPADEGNIQMELYRPNSSSNKKIPARTWASTISYSSILNILTPVQSHVIWINGILLYSL